MKKMSILALFFLGMLTVLVYAQPAVGFEFTTVFGETPPEFDPHFSIYSSEAQLFTALYEGLFTYDPASLEPIPAAVSSWTRSPDGKIYTFVVRPEARWSDGSSLRAEDFKNSWLRLLKNNAQYATFLDSIKGALEYRTGISTDPNSVGISITKDLELRVELLRPSDYFTRLLCHHAFSPLHPSMLGVTAWENRIPFPVNGPYRFKRYDASGLYLEANPYYWGAKNVSIPNLRMIFTDSAEQASRLFNNDEAHWLAGNADYDAILLDEALQINPIFSTHYWYFDCSAEPWSNPFVRQALALLLPWEEIRNPEYYTVPATTLILPLPGYSTAKGIEKSDRDKALTLLSEAGFPQGKGLPEIRIFFADGADSRRVAALMTTAWETLEGVKVTSEPLNPAQYYDTISKSREAGRVTLAHTTWIGDFADPEAFLQMWTTESPLNEARVNDPAFMEALKQSYQTTGEERMGFLAQAETILLQNAVVLPIYHSLAISVIDLDYIDGWYQNALDIHPYKYLKFGIPSIQPNVAHAAQALVRMNF